MIFRVEENCCTKMGMEERTWNWSRNNVEKSPCGGGWTTSPHARMHPRIRSDESVAFDPPQKRDPSRVSAPSGATSSGNQSGPPPTWRIYKYISKRPVWSPFQPLFVSLFRLFHPLPPLPFTRVITFLHIFEGAVEQKLWVSVYYRGLAPLLSARIKYWQRIGRTQMGGKGALSSCV